MAGTTSPLHRCRECDLVGDHHYLCSRDPSLAFFAADLALIYKLGAAPGTLAWDLAVAQIGGAL